MRAVRTENRFGLLRRTCCPACGRDQSVLRYSQPFTAPPITTYLRGFYGAAAESSFGRLGDAEYTLEECRHCGLVFQQCVPDEAFMQRLYEEWIDPAAAHAQARRRDARYYSGISRQIEALVRYFAISPTELRALDFGMGWGEWCHMARAHGIRVMGAELSRERIDAAKADGIAIVDWHDMPKHRFDIINSEQVFEHLAEPFETLQHLARALQPGGVIRIGVPNGEDIDRRLAVMDWTAEKGSRNSLNAVAPLEHINCFRRSALIELGRRAGLMPVDVPTAALFRRNLTELSLRDLIAPVRQRLSTRFSGVARGALSIYLRRMPS